MKGIIVTGHGSFASGLASGLKLLAGEPEGFEAVDFDPGDSVENLTKKLQAALDRLSGCEEIAVFADLKGGSPFNAAARLKMAGIGRPVELAGNISLPAVIQAYLTRPMYSKAAKLMDDSLEEAKKGMERLIPERPFKGDEAADEDEVEVE